ncbi:ABC transporter [Tamlana nanhaiensis]|uniref:Transport permease protein n=1 Tax=Neotamlana nanhaiensis TaxID=1382798 RepID=A0A0D7W5X3_9FLAO|nr:ABC transporter permease [Tamlana nanhaiensis]KJD34536.1 ABC transporter [Tamlana nanhaiensis]
MKDRILQKNSDWDWEIKPETSWWQLNFREIFSYKDLIKQLVRKEFLGQYQQTLLGPFWALVQPLLSVIVYVFVFNRVIGVPTSNIPPFLFNLAGLTLWNLFSEIFLQTSRSFAQNADIFSKVYFPRIIVPISALWLQLSLFCIQLFFLILVCSYYYITGGITFNVANFILFIPVIIITAGIGFGGGLIFSVLTSKYRDLLSLIQLVIRLLMFASPVFYSLSLVPPNAKWIVKINPLSSLFEYFRFALLGIGNLELSLLVYSIVFMLILLLLSIMLFNKISDSLIDVL